MEMSVPSEFRVRHFDESARNREAESLTAARLAQDERVDADQLASDVDEWTAAVAMIDRRIGLDVHHRVVRIGLPRNRAHYAHRH